MSEREIREYEAGNGDDRSTDEILQDIELRRESIARTVDQAGQKVQEQLNLKEQVRAHPLGSLAVAAGTAFVVGRLMSPTRNPLDRVATRITRNVDDVGHSLRRSINSLGVAPSPFRTTLMTTLVAIAARALMQSFRSPVVTSRPNQTEEQDHAV